MDHETPEVLPREEVPERLRRVQEAMGHAGIDVLLAQQNSDMFYLTGFVAQGVVAIPREGESIFLVRRPLGRTGREVTVPAVQRFEKNPVAALRARGVNLPASPVLGLELDVLPQSWAQRSVKSCDSAWEHVKDAGELLRRVRSIKSPWERKQHRHAATVVDKALEAVPDLMKEGMRESELKAKLELKMREMGAQGFVPQRRFNQEPFQGHVLSGISACLASYQDSAMGGPGVSRRYPQDAGFKKIRRGEPVVVDLANAWNGYIADETRTFAMGSVPREVQEKYELTIDVLEKMRAKLVAGAVGGELFEWCVEQFRAKGFEENLGGLGEDRVMFVGHGIGVELDELPVIARGFDNKVEVGQVVALEPKLVFEGVGMIGVEDSHFITDAGAEVFTKVRYNTLE